MSHSLSHSLSHKSTTFFIFIYVRIKINSQKHERGLRFMFETGRSRPIEPIGEVFHKEKYQKKYNKTKGQYDNLKKYGTNDNPSSDKLATDDKQIRREAKYLKNIHIDEAYKKLLMMNVISEGKNRNWYFYVLHKLGVAFVLAQADQACKSARDKSNPAPLFHFLINKAINTAQDPFMPRFN